MCLPRKTRHGVKNGQYKQGVQGMGDRVSIAFKNGQETSVTLFHHWGGMEFVEKARDYVEDLKKEVKKTT